MRKPALVLVVAGLLCLAQAGQAADLQAGWYANVYSVDVVGYDSDGMPRMLAGGQFTIPLGHYGVFELTGAPLSLD